MSEPLRGARAPEAAPAAPRITDRPSQHRAESEHSDKPSARRSWAIPVVASLAVVLGGAGAWWLFKEQQRAGDLEVAKLKAEIAALAKQTADLKAGPTTAHAGNEFSTPQAPSGGLRVPDPATLQAAKLAALKKASDSLSLLQTEFPSGTLPSLLEQTLHATTSGDSEAIGAALEQFTALRLPRGGDAVAARDRTSEGLAHLSRGEAELAAGRFAEAVLLDMTDPLILENLALALAKAGELQKSASAALMALAVAPSRASTWQTLATTFSRMDGGASPRAVMMMQNAYRFAEDPSAAKVRIERLGVEEPDAGVKQLAAAVLPTLPTIKPYTVR